MNEPSKYCISIFVRIAWLFIPFIQNTFAALAKNPDPAISVFRNENIRTVAASYSDVLLMICCLIFLIIFTTIGYFFPTPQYGPKPYPKIIKILISVSCGILAFIYYLHTEKVINFAAIFWVAGVSFVSPATIHLIHAAAIKLAGTKTNVTDEDLKKINESFRRREEE